MIFGGGGLCHGGGACLGTCAPLPVFCSSYSFRAIVGPAVSNFPTFLSKRSQGWNSAGLTDRSASLESRLVLIPSPCRKVQMKVFCLAVTIFNKAWKPKRWTYMYTSARTKSHRALDRCQLLCGKACCVVVGCVHGEWLNWCQRNARPSASLCLWSDIPLEVSCWHRRLICFYIPYAWAYV